MATIHDTTLSPEKTELLTSWLPGQPWYLGTGRAPELAEAGGFRIDDPQGEVGIEFMLVTDGSGDRATTYQVPMTYRAHALAGAGGALIGTAEHGVLGHRWIYDAAHDPVLTASLVALIQGDAEPQAQDVSNTADPTVISQPVTGGSLTALGSAVTANEPSGTDLRVETANAAGARGRLIIRINRILQPGGAAAPPANQGSHACPPPGGCLTAPPSAASSPPPSTATCPQSDHKTLLCSLGGGAVDVGRGGGRLPGEHPVPHPGRAGMFRGPQKLLACRHGRGVGHHLTQHGGQASLSQARSGHGWRDLDRGRVMPGGPRLAADVAISLATKVDLHRFFTVPASGLHTRGIGLSCGQAAGWISQVRAAV